MKWKLKRLLGDFLAQLKENSTNQPSWLYFQTLYSLQTFQLLNHYSRHSDSTHHGNYLITLPCRQTSIVFAMYQHFQASANLLVSILHVTK